MQLADFIEALSRHASAAEIKDAVDEHTGRRPGTRDKALTAMKRLLKGGDRAVVEALLSEVYAEGLRAWAAELGETKQNRDAAISTIFEHYFGDGADEPDGDDEVGDENEDELDVDMFADDIVDFAAADELRDAAVAVTPNRPSTKGLAVDAIRKHLKRSPGDARGVLSKLFATTLRAWCRALDIEYADKDAAVDDLMEYYRSVDDDDADDDDEGVTFLDDLAQFATAKEIRDAAEDLTSEKAATKAIALDALSDHLTECPADVGRILAMVSADGLRAWCDANDVDYLGKQAAATALAEPYVPT
jgi:hypothetical protein